MLAKKMRRQPTRLDGDELRDQGLGFTLSTLWYLVHSFCKVDLTRQISKGEGGGVLESL